MHSWRNGIRTFPKQAGYPELMLPITLPEPLPLLKSASIDSVMTALASIPAELRERPERHLSLIHI